MHYAEEIHKLVGKVSKMMNAEDAEDHVMKPGEKSMPKKTDSEDMPATVRASKKRKEMMKAGGKADYSQSVIEIAMKKVK